MQSDKRKYQSYFQKRKKEGCREPHPPKGELLLCAWEDHEANPHGSNFKAHTTQGGILGQPTWLF